MEWNGTMAVTHMIAMMEIELDWTVGFCFIFQVFLFFVGDLDLFATWLYLCADTLPRT